jgi:hypothetical protein
MEQRRESRYNANIPVEIYCNRRVVIGMTEDVSNRGMRVRTSVCAGVRELLRISVSLPGYAYPIPMHAMVAHASVDGSHPQGYIGLELYGISARDRARWVAFVGEVARSPRSERGERCAVIEIPPEDTLTSRKLQMGNTLGGQVFVDTPMRLQRGNYVYLVSRQPISGRVSVFEGRVTRVIEEEREHGDQGIVVKLLSPARPGQSAAAAPKGLRPAAPRGHQRDYKVPLMGGSCLRIRGA